MLAGKEADYNPPHADASAERPRNSVAVIEGYIDVYWAWLGAAFYVLFSAARPPFELVVFETSDETLSKIITLGADGQPVSDSSHCRMTRGWAWRWKSRNLYAFAKLIKSMPDDHAIAVGRLKTELQNKVEIYKKDRLALASRWLHRPDARQSRIFARATRTCALRCRHQRNH